MARVTVEDCVTKIPNRFKLVVIASQRARNISAGEALNVERDNDKNPVVALREIAEDIVDKAELEESLIRGLQKFVEMDDPEDDDVDLIAIRQELDSEAGNAVPQAGPVAEADPKKTGDEDQATATADLAGDSPPLDDEADKGEKDGEKGE